MDHWLVNVSQCQISDAFANGAQVILGKASALTNEIVRPRMKQHDTGAPRRNFLHNLTDFKRCSCAEITCSDEPHAPKVKPGTPPGLGVPRLHDRAFRTKAGFEQDKKFVRGKI